MARQIVMQQPCSCRKSINYLGVLTHPWPRSHCLDLTLYLHSIQGVVIPLSRPLTTLLAWGTWTRTQQLALTRAVEKFANSGNRIGKVPHFGDGCRGGCVLKRGLPGNLYSQHQLTSCHSCKARFRTLSSLMNIQATVSYVEISLFSTHSV